MKKKILVSYPIPKEGLTSLYDNYDVFYPEKPLSAKDLKSMLPSYHGLLAIFIRKVDRDIIKAAFRLEIISNYGAGFNNIDIKTATRQGIVVCNTPITVTKPTAELCMGMVVSLLRNIAKTNHELRTISEYKFDIMKDLGRTLCGKTLGILGMGRIGKEVAKRAVAFDMKVIYHNRKRLAREVENTFNATYVSFNQLVRSSDILSIHTPLTEETYQLIDKNVFSMMKSSAYIVNTARGPIIAEDDLVAALQQKQLAGAALDVFEKEPKIHPALLTMDNVVLTPHIGSATREDRIATGVEAAENFISFWQKHKPINVVNPMVLPKI